MHASSRANMRGIRQNGLLLILAAVYWSLALLEPWHLFGQAGEGVYYIQNLAWFVFVLVHGSKRYGWDNLFAFFTITFLISWSLEAASIATGFPFGHFYYTEQLGPKIGPVPMAVMPAYFAAGYLAWTVSTLFHAHRATGIDRPSLFLVPITASFLMVMWDLCLDPIRSTIDGAWVWENGGVYYGVPVSNFAGWYLAVFLIFQTFAVYLYRLGGDVRVEQDKLYWYLAPLMYLGLAVEFLLNPFFHSTNLEIYWSVFLTCSLTMVFTSILAILVVSRLDTERL